MSDGIDKAYLKTIIDATAANQPVYVSNAIGQPMLDHKPALIEVNLEIHNPADPSQVMCRATPDAVVYLATAEVAPVDAAKPAGNYAVMTGIALPPAKKRGNTSGSGAPTKYPFESMEVGGVFFSGNSEHKKGDALKALGSTISSQNKKYSTPTGAMKTVTRAVRDKQTHKAVLDAAGKKVTETVQLPVLEYSRKFTIRAVEAGYGNEQWKAPEAGALIARVK